jgi:hypothetical protein
MWIGADLVSSIWHAKVHGADWTASPIGGTRGTLETRRTGCSGTVADEVGLERFRRERVGAGRVGCDVDRAVRSSVGLENRSVTRAGRRRRDRSIGCANSRRRHVGETQTIDEVPSSARG